jgi:hypothetical protein
MKIICDKMREPCILVESAKKSKNQIGNGLVIYDKIDHLIPLKTKSRSGIRQKSTLKR